MANYIIPGFYDTSSGGSGGGVGGGTPSENFFPLQTPDKNNPIDGPSTGTQHKNAKWNDTKIWDDGKNWFDTWYLDSSPTPTPTPTDKFYPNNVINIKAIPNNGQITISWTDPGNTVVEGQTFVTWGGTKLVMKQGSYPTSETDGTVVVDNKVLNQYKTNGFVITGLTNDVTYYFQLFPYSINNVYNKNTVNRVEAIPRQYRTMTVVIDYGVSDLDQMCTYADDAVGMVPGSDEWDDFFGHYPCTIKECKEFIKLNKNNFKQNEDGVDLNPNELMTGTLGDVMICFPRHYWKIAVDNDKLIVSMTEEENKEGYVCLSHMRGDNIVDKFYVGAYMACIDTDKTLRSLPQQGIVRNYSLPEFKSKLISNTVDGKSYSVITFYQIVYLQIMYILKYKNLNSQGMVGQGLSNVSTWTYSTGITDDWGMNGQLHYQTNPEDKTSGTAPMKLFGIEDLWGNLQVIIDCIYTIGNGMENKFNIAVSTDSREDSANYKLISIQDWDFNAQRSGNISTVMGDNELAFYPKTVGGKYNKYRFCDSTNIHINTNILYGGHYNNGDGNGIFFMSYITLNAGSGLVTTRISFY